MTEQEATNAITEKSGALQKLVDDGLSAKISSEVLLQRLCEAGADPREAEDYIQQFTQHQGEVELPTNAPIREPTPEGVSTQKRDALRAQRDEAMGPGNRESALAHEAALDEAAWRLLEAKIQHATVGFPGDSSLTASKLLRMLGGNQSSRTIPSSVLDAAPHLRDLSANISKDPHLKETWRLQRAYTTGRDAVDGIVDLLQAQSLV
jgi:hypothetical protein